MTLIVSLSLVTIHHTKCPQPLVPGAGADGERGTFAFLCSPWHSPWQVGLAAGCQHLGMVLGMALCLAEPAG